MDDLKCSVCGSTDNVAVRCSRVGPVSNAYCSECLEKDYMGHDEAMGLLFCVPYSQLRSDLQSALVVSNGKVMKMREWAHSEEVRKELEELNRSFNEFCENYGKEE